MVGIVLPASHGGYMPVPYAPWWVYARTLGTLVGIDLPGIYALPPMVAILPLGI